MNYSSAQSTKSIRPPSSKNILTQMAHFVRQDIDFRPQPIQQLDCYDRIKKMMPQNHALYQQNLVNSVLVETHLNKVSSKLTSMSMKDLKLKKMKTNVQEHYSNSKLYNQAKKLGLQKYADRQQQILKQTNQKIKQQAQKQLTYKIQKVLADRDMEMQRIKQEYDILTIKMRQKQLQIEGLKLKCSNMESHIYSQQIEIKQQKQLLKDNQKFINLKSFILNFRQTFGDLTIQQLKHKLQDGINKCLERFDQIQNKNYQTNFQQKKQLEQKIRNLTTQIEQIKQRQYELINNLKTIQINNSIFGKQNQLSHKTQLQSLRSVILQVYTNWYSQRSESQKKMLTQLGFLSKNYSFAEMVKYIAQHSNNFSSSDKLNDFIFKLLRGIHKLRRLIFPAQGNQPLDALPTLDKIQKWASKTVHMQKHTAHDLNDGKYLQTPNILL